VSIFMNVLDVVKFLSIKCKNYDFGVTHTRIKLIKSYSHALS